MGEKYHKNPLWRLEPVNGQFHMTLCPQ